MASRSHATHFEEFYPIAVHRWESILRALRSLRNFYEAEHGLQIFLGMDELQTIIDRGTGYNIRQSSNIHQDQPNPPDVDPLPRPHPINPSANAPPNASHNVQVIQPNPQIVEDGPLLEPQPRDTTEELRQRTLDLEEENEKLQTSMRALKTNISVLKANLMGVRADLASKAEQTRDFVLAQQQYHALSDAKAEEKMNSIRNNQITPQTVRAEQEELTHTYRSAKLLVKLNEYRDAESAFRHVLQRRKALYNDPNIKLEASCEVQFDFCDVLRLQGTPAALGDAEDLYHAQANLESQDSQNPNNRNWTLRNAIHLACLRGQQRQYRTAIDNLRYVWSRRHGASAECMIEMQSEIAGLLELFKQNDLDVYSEEVLRIVRESNEALAPRLVSAMTAAGLRLHEGDQHAQAVDFLHMAWINVPPAAQQAEGLKLGWALAWSFCQTARYDQTERVLECLLELFDTPSGPSQYHVRALLARIQLDAGKVAQAKQNAQIVYDQHRTQNILRSHEYHHADTLLCAIAQEKRYYSKWSEAKLIWNEVYENARILRQDPNNREQVRRHAETGLRLAKK